MGITEWALKSDRVVVMLLVIIVAGGLKIYFDMPRAEDPGFIIRTAQIVTQLPGASPQRVEELVTDKIEKVVQELPEVKSIVSESRTGVSIVLVNIKESYTELRPIWDRLRRKISDAKDTLPAEVIGPMVDDEFGDVYGIILTLTGDGYSYAELKKVADDVRNDILLLNEAAKAEIRGIQKERIFVDYTNAKLTEIGLSPQGLIQILSAQNIINPGGSIRIDQERIHLEPTGNFESLDDLKQTTISLPGGKGLMQLGDIVQIYRGYVDPPNSKVTYNGVPALAIAVSLREGGNILRLGEDIQKLVLHLEEIYPVGLNFDFVAFQPKDVENAVNLFMRNLLEAIVIVAGMMFLSLGLSTGLIVSTLVPTCILMTFIFMRFFNVWLDGVSLSALIISLGLLVDNGIVMVDMISVNMRQGKPFKTAAIEAAEELKVPLLSGTLITCAAFLPIYLAESETGEYTAPLFSVVTISLLCSWVLALTLTPLLCKFFLKLKTKSLEETYQTRVYKVYRTILIACLKHPWKTVLGMLSAFLISILGFKFIPIIFFPPTDRTYFTGELELPSGTSIERTEQVVHAVESFIQTYLYQAKKTQKIELQKIFERALKSRGLSQNAIQERVKDSPLFEDGTGITSWSSFIGDSAPRFHIAHEPKIESPEYAFMILNVNPQAVIDDLLVLLDDYVFEHFPEARSKFAKTEYGPPVEYPIGIRVLGKEIDALFSYVDQIKEKIKSIPGTRNVHDSWGFRTKKLVVRINQPRARRAGVTSLDIATSLQTGLAGITMTQYREGSQIIPVILRSTVGDRDDLLKLESLTVFSQTTGKYVSLKQVADVEIEWESSKILRRNLQKSVTVFAELEPGVTATDITDQLFPWLEDKTKTWEAGYKYETGGEYESSEEANQSILEKIPVAIFIIVLLLVIEFNSFRRTVIHLSTVIMGLIGVVIGLLVTGSYFGFMTLLGMIALAGVEVGHAIVLLDRIHIEMTVNKRPPAAAIVEAAQSRFRPIYLTAATAAGGLVPLWLTASPMWEPMAITLIFGLFFATLLTLGVLPVLFSIMFRVDFSQYQYGANYENHAH